MLNWQIANPEIAERFIIERMTTNQGWTEISSVVATDMQTDYRVTDNYPAIGYNLYRIKMIEKNGASTYSSIRRIFFESANNVFTIKPNPANDKIIIAGNFNSPVDLKLSDVSGKIIMTKKIVSSQTEIVLSNLASGVYFIRINQTVRKLVIR